MKVLGIDFDANKASFVLVSGTHEEAEVTHKERLQLGETRSQADMAAFRDGVRRILELCAPDAISVRAKPENGQMRAGAAALKMEAIVLAESAAPLEFVSSVKASKQADRDGLFAYLQPAYKAAMARLAAPTKKK
ncbi:hypothetical protein D3C71_402000 [compost metagenome]